ncbi:MAG: hypothetical protein QOI98_2294 [Solirubrobacteraceae bacterium]|jgi:hypothetical protein|nr:hypothetical protein [Solirubrobacteraceae bacterium]
MPPHRFSRDAAIVLGLAGTAMPFASSSRAQAERWLRVLRLYGEAGRALQALGVPEGPLETTPESLPSHERATMREVGDGTVQAVTDHAARLATLRGAPMVGTLDILFAVLALYGADFDRALYVRGSSREDLLAALKAAQPVISDG